MSDRTPLLNSGSNGTSWWRKRWTFWRVVAWCAGLSLVVIVLAGIGAAFVGYLVYDHVTQPGGPGQPVSVTIPAGANGREVGKLLVNAGLVEHEMFFRLAMRLNTEPGNIRHGVYLLPKGLSAVELLHRLYDGPERSGETAPYKITIPEGLTIKQIAQYFEHPEAFIAAAADPALIARAGIKAKTLEGFLMPNTYFFEQAPTEHAVVERMVEQFQKAYVKLLEEVKARSAPDKYMVITVASMVEEEAKSPEERALIASVLYNRLKQKMPLQMDSTIQFALEKYGQRLLDSDKAIDSPYNTYKVAGLPPGPISNPGIESIRAALAPASTDYLYFVSNADGLTHSFSKTLKEHEQHVAAFRKAIAAQRQAQQPGPASPAVTPAHAGASL